MRAIILAGSGDRIDEFAQRWSALHGDAPVVSLPKEERFVTRYCAGVLFASHGMGMPSASIAVQELMRMVFFLKGGDHGRCRRCSGPGSGPAVASACPAGRSS